MKFRERIHGKFFIYTQVLIGNESWLIILNIILYASILQSSKCKLQWDTVTSRKFVKLYSASLNPIGFKYSVTEPTTYHCRYNPSAAVCQNVCFIPYVSTRISILQSAMQVQMNYACNELMINNNKKVLILITQHTYSDRFEFEAQVKLVLKGISTVLIHT